MGTPMSHVNLKICQCRTISFSPCHMLSLKVEVGVQPECVKSMTQFPNQYWSISTEQYVDHIE